MTEKQLFSKTMPFVRAKLMMGAVAVLAAVILLAVFMGIGWLFGDAAMMIVFIIWAVAVRIVWSFIMHYFGYLIKAGHIAVVAEACVTGKIPENQVAYGKNKVTERFLTSNVYFAVDNLINAAIRQIQSRIGSLGTKLDFVPGMEAATGILRFYVNIALGYIDECCLGWTFLKKDQSAYKSAADGIVIYAKNFKAVLKGAGKTLLHVIFLTAVTGLLVFVPVGILFKILHLSGIYAFCLAFIIAWVIKFAVLDSYIMIRMMCVYMQVAPDTVITFDLYSFFSGISASFRELFTKAQKEDPSQFTASKASFCGQCGAGNPPGTRFCGSCGAKI